MSMSRYVPTPAGWLLRNASSVGVKLEQLTVGAVGNSARLAKFTPRTFYEGMAAVVASWSKAYREPQCHCLIDNFYVMARTLCRQISCPDLMR